MADSKKKASKKVSNSALKKAAKKSSSKKVTEKSAEKVARNAAGKSAKIALNKSAKKAPAKGTKSTASKAPGVVREGTVIADRPVLVTDGMVPLSSLVGDKGIVLYFYPKDATPGCTQEACDFRDMQAELKRLGYSVVGVSPDSAESHRRFATKQSLNFPLISDTEQRLCSDFGVWGEKQLYGRSFMGVIRSTFILDRELRVRKVFSPVRVTGHTAEVEKAIASV